MNRRHFLTSTLAALTGAGALAACNRVDAKAASDGAAGSTSAPAGPSSSGASTTTTGAPKSSNASASKSAKGSKTDQRRLVIIELSGGNDGMSTLVPFGMTGYKDLRSRIAIDPKDLLHINDQVGLHKNLKALQNRGLAIVQGIGTPNPDGSHFAMMERWWKGDLRGNASLPTGFLGRLADAIAPPDARAVALSIGSGSHPALVSSKAPTLSIPRADVAGALVGANADDKARYSFQQALIEMAAETSGDQPRLATARRSGRDAIGFAGTLHDLKDDAADGYPGGTLSDGLRLAARLLAADSGLRIVHVPMGADFDTHEDHASRHADLMTNLAASLDAFLADLDDRGLGDHVLVATTSEFGRTAKDNASGGLDHGTASCALLAGPVKAGLYGEYPSLTKLTEDGQLIATVGFDRYYATLAESWFGVPASDVLPGRVKPLTGLLQV
jgi:uncharacterized protein (DUF1501 family)